MTSTMACRAAIRLVAAVFWLSGIAFGADPVRPNVVIILLDDLGSADLGCQGSTDLRTPRIDSLATAGARFTNAYSNGAFCTPTRAALMGCRYQQRFGVEGLERADGVNHLPLAVSTLPERLRAVGYRTGFVGKWHVGPKPETQGFEPVPMPRELAVPPRDQTLLHGAIAASFIQSRRADEQPFFLYLALKAVHTPVHAADEYVARFASIADEKRRMYAAMLAAADDAVGMVLDALDDTGKAAGTLVICTSDNGGPTTRGGANGSSNAPFRGSKFETFEGGIRVPLVMRWPGIIPPGTTYREPVITFDLSATALAAARADRGATDGVDLRPFLTGDAVGPPHEILFWRSRTEGNNHAVRQGPWKFVHSTFQEIVPGGKPRSGGLDPPSRRIAGRDMLFNLAADPLEARDLAAENPGKLAELKHRYAAWNDEVDADARALGITPQFGKPVSAPTAERKRHEDRRPQ